MDLDSCSEDSETVTKSRHLSPINVRNIFSHNVLYVRATPCKCVRGHTKNILDQALFLLETFTSYSTTTKLCKQ